MCAFWASRGVSAWWSGAASNTAHAFHNNHLEMSLFPLAEIRIEQMAFTNGTVIFLNGFRLSRIIIYENIWNNSGLASVGLAWLCMPLVWFGSVRFAMVWYGFRVHFIPSDLAAGCWLRQYLRSTRIYLYIFHILEWPRKYFANKEL